MDDTRSGGNGNGVLDTQTERSYITQIHIVLGSTYMTTGSSEYTLESDVYPPLLPLKAQSP